MVYTLSPQEINQRLIRLRNLERLHQELKERHDRLKEENRHLRTEVRSLTAIVAEQSAIIAAQNLRIEELERMVFGRRKKQRGRTIEEAGDNRRERARAARAVDSYRRPVPREEEITDKRQHAINACPDCGAHLSRIEERIFYEEDIVIPPETPTKTVVKHTVERGFCGQCRGWRTSHPLPSALVVLGPKVKLYICYLVILIRLSFEGVRTLLQTTYALAVSDGEIAMIIQKESRVLRPAYEALKERIREQAGGHYDETGYPVTRGSQGNYAWVVAGTNTNEAVFVCGRSRGKGVAEELKGASKQVGITDDYGAYRTLFSKHQLCWAHPHRKLRDLVESRTLRAVQRPCAAAFRDFARLYERVRRVTGEPFDERKRKRAAARLGREFDRVAAADPLDPPALGKIKARLRERKECYFTCVLEDGIPPDNNKAERALRHLVLKRKTSLGSKTERGAGAVGILTSVLLSLFWKKPANFFGELMEMRGV